MTTPDSLPRPLLLAFLVAATFSLLHCALDVSRAAIADEVDVASREPADNYLLRYKLATGDVLRYSVEHKATVRSTIKATTQTVTTDSTSVRAWKVLDVLDNGEMEFAHVVEHVHMKNQLPDRAAAEYDSRKDAVPPPGFEQVASAVGVTLTIHRISPMGEVLKREVKHPHAGQDGDLPITMLLPAEEVPVGFKWDEPHQVFVETKDQKRRIDTRRHFELESVQNGVATIKMTYQVLTPVDAEIESQLVQRLASGHIRFDIERGRILSQQQDVDRRIVGFAGPASSMHYRSRFTERLLKEGEQVAAKVDGDKS
jgi:hypothetical protein